MTTILRPVTLEAEEQSSPTWQAVARRPKRYQHQSLWLVVLIAAFVLISCGDAAFTVIGTINGTTMYFVISGNADDVAQLKDSYAKGGGSGQIVDGDKHSGNLICEHDTAKNGHHLHFALYGSGISTEQCRQIFASFP